MLYCREAGSLTRKNAALLSSLDASLAVLRLGWGQAAAKLAIDSLSLSVGGSGRNTLRYERMDVLLRSTIPAGVQSQIQQQQQQQQHHRTVVARSLSHEKEHEIHTLQLSP